MVVAMVASPRYRPQSCTTRLEMMTTRAAQLVALVHDGLQHFVGPSIRRRARNRLSRISRSSLTQSLSSTARSAVLASA